jgi:hypothetical protein
VVAQLDGVGEVLERQRVVGKPGDRQGARDGAERDHEVLVADRERPATVSTSTRLRSKSNSTARPSTRSECGHIARSGTTTWRGSSVPEAASGRNAVKSIEFSG